MGFWCSSIMSLPGTEILVLCKLNPAFGFVCSDYSHIEDYIPVAVRYSESFYVHHDH